MFFWGIPGNRHGSSGGSYRIGCCNMLILMGIAGQEGIISETPVYMFSNFKSVIGKFFFQFLRENFWRVALEGGAKSTVDSLRRPMIASFPIAIPPLPEQQAIATFLDHKTAMIDALVSKVGSAIDRLKEYRTALISAVVTGRIDVREVV